MFVLINYETAEIELLLNPATLHTTTDSLNVKLINGAGNPEMKTDIPYVKTVEHPDYELNFEAELHLNGKVKQHI